MKIIKLNAIGSTNSFLKKAVADLKVENFTVVVSANQTSGRGQHGAKWISQAGKNLTFSVFCLFSNLPVTHHRYLNFAVSLSIFEALQELFLPKLTIKWPNDILSGNYKICGILIENSLKKSNIISSVIGIGLNVNQEIFPAELPNASSIKSIIKKETDLEKLLNSILEKMKENISLLNSKKYNKLEDKYLLNLYKKGIPSMFKTAKKVLFMGKISGISESGKLQIELLNGTVKDFGLKEVSFVL